MRDTISVERLREGFKYNPETGQLYRRNKKKGGWRRTGTKNSRGYLYVSVDGVKILVHRVIWTLVFGEWPKHTIDHINRDKTDNRLCNLRDDAAGERVE